MPQYDITHLVQAHPDVWERERVKPLNINKAMRKALDKVNKTVIDYARAAVHDPNSLVSQRAKKLESIAHETGISAQELAKADIEMDIIAILHDFLTPRKQGCYSQKDLTCYAEGGAKGEERESIFLHCGDCAPCLIDVFQYYSTFKR